MNPIKDPIKDALVPLWTNLNANGSVCNRGITILCLRRAPANKANGSVRWHTFVYLNLFHWPMGRNSGNHNGVCRYIQARFLR